MDNPIVQILLGKDPVVDWLVPDMLPQGSLIQLAGEPSAGKSCFSYALSMAVAAGIPFLGFNPVRAAPILYCDVENGRPDRDQYIRWAWRGLQKPIVDPVLKNNFWTSHFELGGPNWPTILRKRMDECCPLLVIFDTATPCFAIENENDNSEANKVIKALRLLQHAYVPSPTMIVLRHAKTFMEPSSGGDYLRKARGAQTWKAQTDATWFYVRAEGRMRGDGLKRAHIEVDKVRAFGLREDVYINPSWIGNREGLILTRTERPETKQ